MNNLSAAPQKPPLYRRALGSEDGHFLKQTKPLPRAARQAGFSSGGMPAEYGEFHLTALSRAEFEVGFVIVESLA